MFKLTLCLDATKERLRLEINPGLNSERCKNSFDVYVSIQRMGWYVHGINHAYQTDLIQGNFPDYD